MRPHDPRTVAPQSLLEHWSRAISAAETVGDLWYVVESMEGWRVPEAHRQRLMKRLMFKRYQINHPEANQFESVEDMNWSEQ
jgi:hypothetical protein